MRCVRMLYIFSIVLKPFEMFEMFSILFLFLDQTVLLVRNALKQPAFNDRGNTSIESEYSILLNTICHI